jgi:hypothetical protein
MVLRSPGSVSRFGPLSLPATCAQNGAQSALVAYRYAELEALPGDAHVMRGTRFSRGDPVQRG